MSCSTNGGGCCFSPANLLKYLIGAAIGGATVYGVMSCGSCRTNPSYALQKDKADAKKDSKQQGDGQVIEHLKPLSERTYEQVCI